MKNYFLLVAFSFLTLTATAQELQYDSEVDKPSTWCGATLSQQQEDWLDYYLRNDALFDTKSLTTPYIPIRAHIVCKDDGSGYYFLTYLFTAICQLNTRYLPTGFHFYLDGNVDYINSTSFYNDGSSSNPVAVSLMQSHNVANKLNIYFVQSSPGLCGYYTPATDNVVIVGSCGLPNGTTITHEVGHYFSLPHTFNRWENVYTSCGVAGSATAPSATNREKVNGTNCSTKGDKFCDTPPDYNPYRWSCPNTCVNLDPNGDTVKPDQTLYMSYASDVCTSQFSTQQMNAMKANINGGPRSYFGSNPVQSEAVVGIPTQFLPLSNSTTDPSNQTIFKWSSVPGADRYCLYVFKSAGSSTQPVIQKLLTDTFYTSVSELTANLAYKWKVMAFTNGHPCGTYTAVQQFTTATPTSINEVSSTARFQLSPNPVAAGDVLHIYLQSHTTQNAEYNLYGLDGRLVQHQNFTLKQGDNYEQVNTTGIASGIYIVRITSGSFQLKEKIVIE